MGICKDPTHQKRVIELLGRRKHVDVCRRHGETGLSLRQHACQVSDETRARRTSVNNTLLFREAGCIGDAREHRLAPSWSGKDLVRSFLIRTSAQRPFKLQLSFNPQRHAASRNLHCELSALIVLNIASPLRFQTVLEILWNAKGSNNGRPMVP